jgi:hypothetical protein
VITFLDHITEVRREIALRERVYPGWVQRGRLTEGQATYALEAMREVRRTLERLEADTRQPSLF